MRTVYHPPFEGQPSADLLQAVRAALVLRGSSLSAYAREIGVKRQNLRAALVGEWTGPKARALVRRVMVDTIYGAAP